MVWLLGTGIMVDQYLTRT